MTEALALPPEPTPASSPIVTSPKLPKYARDADRPYEGDPWSRQPGESSRSYEAFTIYLNLEGERTYAATDKIYCAKYGLKLGNKSNQWGKKHRWVERAVAYDNYITAQMVATHRRQAVKAATKHAQQAAEIQEVLMLPMNKLRERIKARGDEFSFVDALDDEALTKLARAFAQDVPTFAKMEREALTSTTDVVIPRHELKAKGILVRQMLENKDIRALAEKVTFQIDVTETDAAEG